MTDWQDVPEMSDGDWVDGAWLNQYLRDNIRVIRNAFLNAGSLAYALTANTLAELVKPAVDSYLRMSAAGVPSYDPVEDVGVPSGTLLPFAGGTVPDGYLLCNGAAVSRTTYARLFTAIGTAWGVGNGSTTFNVPDGRGRTMIGAGTGSGLTARTLGTSLGEESHTQTTDELVAHDHAYNHDGAEQGVNSGTQLARYPALGSYATGSKGGGQPFNIMQPSFVGNWIIKD
jgi:microcystin-dependent protein